MEELFSYALAAYLAGTALTVVLGIVLVGSTDQRPAPTGTAPGQP